MSNIIQVARSSLTSLRITYSLNPSVTQPANTQPNSSCSRATAQADRPDGCLRISIFAVATSKIDLYWIRRHAGGQTPLNTVTHTVDNLWMHVPNRCRVLYCWKDFQRFELPRQMLHQEKKKRQTMVLSKPSRVNNKLKPNFHLKDDVT